MTNEIKQLSFADMEDKRPLPLIVAERWGFSLQHYIVDEVHYFSALDWIAGIGSTDIFRAEPTLKRLQSRLHITKLQYFDYIDLHGNEKQSPFGTDEDMYIISQNMQVTKARPALKEIQDYLANAGSEMDDWRRNPDKMLSVAQSRMLQDIERHEKAGLGDRPEIALLKARHESIVTSETLRKTIARVCDNPNYAQITNAEYMALFGKIAKDLKEMLKTKSIRDSLGIHQIRALTLAEGVLEDMLRRNRETTNESILGIIEIAIKPIGRYLLETSQALGVHHITGKSLLESGE